MDFIFPLCNITTLINPLTYHSTGSSMKWSQLHNLGSGISGKCNFLISNFSFSKSMDSPRPVNMIYIFWKSVNFRLSKLCFPLHPPFFWERRDLKLSFIRETLVYKELNIGFLYIYFNNSYRFSLRVINENIIQSGL